MASISNSASNFLLYDVMGMDFAETNERFVIIEKYERHGHVVSVGDSIVDNAVYFYREDGHNQVIHRLNGQPAVISPRLKAWYKNGELHRVGDKPALVRLPMDITDNFPMEKYAVNGLTHRDFDKPAVIFGGNNPRKVWYRNGEIHRDNNKPAIITKNMLYYVDNGYCYKLKIKWWNKFVTILIEKPLVMVTCLFFIFLWLKFF